MSLPTDKIGRHLCTIFTEYDNWIEKRYLLLPLTKKYLLFFTKMVFFFSFWYVLVLRQRDEVYLRYELVCQLRISRIVFTCLNTYNVGVEAKEKQQQKLCVCELCKIR